MSVRRTTVLLVTLLAVLVAGLSPSRAGAQPPGALELVDVSATVVPSRDPDDPVGTYPQGPAACQPQYTILDCGGLLLDLTFAGLAAFPPPDVCSTGPTGERRCDVGTLQGTATIHHVVGCATPGGVRVPELDRHVTTTGFVTAVLGQSRWVLPTPDVGVAHLQVIPPKAHPGHCPDGLRAAQWRMEITGVVATLTSSAYPSATYEVPGTWTWTAEGYDPCDDGKADKDERKAAKAAEKAERKAAKAAEKEQRKADEAAR